MTRRSLLAALPALALVPMGRPVRSTRFGVLDIERHRAFAARGIHLHVITAEGEDVTRRCRWADDRGDGRAECFVYDSAGDGRYVLDRHHKPLLEIIHGITVLEGAPL